MADPATPKRAHEDLEPQSNKKARVPWIQTHGPLNRLNIADPNTFHGILLDYHEQEDKTNRLLKAKGYGTLKSSCHFACNRLHRAVVDRHKKL